MKQDSVFSARGLKVFGLIFLSSVTTLAAPAREASLHIPWSVLESKFQNFLGASGQSWSTQIPDTVLSVGGLNWQVSGITATLRSASNTTTFDGQHLDLKAGPMSGVMTVQKVFADQTVDVDLGGSGIIHAHVQMACGPITLRQSQAQVAASAAFDWTQGTPAASLTGFQLSWAPGSWSVDAFDCPVGPADLTAQLKLQLQDQLKDPSVVQPYISAWLASQVNTQLQSAIATLRQPFQVGTGAAGALSLQVGRLKALSTGLLADLSLSAGAASSAAASHAWSAAELAALPKDRPALIAPVASVEGLLNDTIARQPAWIPVNLNKVDAFQSLLNSRFMQFFVWVDLWNYTSASPFTLYVARPAVLKFDSVSSSGITTSLDLDSILRSQRDGRVWNYVEIWGSAKAKIQLALAQGKLSYTTSLSSTSLQAGFTQEYVDRYGMPGNLPVSTLASSLSGNQSALSGAVQFPDVDFGVGGAGGGGGKFRADGLQWLGGQTVVIPWTAVLP